MQGSHYVVIMNPEKREKLRNLGMVNFSGWVNEKADEFILSKDPSWKPDVWRKPSEIKQ